MKKMRKAKVITALALTVVMLAAMTGIEAAELMSINPTSLELVPGGPAQKCDITISGFAESSKDRFIEAWAANAIGGVGEDITDLEVQLKHPSQGVDSGIGAVWVSLDWVDDTDPDFLELWVSAKSSAPVGATYNLVILNTGGDQQIGFSAGTVDATNIPEFATIAIPVAGILGLVLFFNHRKHKKE